MSTGLGRSHDSASLVLIGTKYASLNDSLYN